MLISFTIVNGVIYTYAIIYVRIYLFVLYVYLCIIFIVHISHFNCI